MSEKEEDYYWFQRFCREQPWKNKLKGLDFDLVMMPDEETEEDE